MIEITCLNFDNDPPDKDHPIRWGFSNLSKSRLNSKCLGSLKCKVEFSADAAGTTPSSEEFFIVGLSGNESKTEKVHKYLRGRLNSAVGKVYVSTVSANKSIYALIPGENVGTWRADFFQDFCDRYNRLLDKVATKRELFETVGDYEPGEYKKIIVKSITGGTKRVLSAHEIKLVNTADAFKKRMVWNVKALKEFLCDSVLRNRTKTDLDWADLFEHFSKYGVSAAVRPDVQTEFFDLLLSTPEIALGHMFSTTASAALINGMECARRNKKVKKTARQLARAIALSNHGFDYNYKTRPPDCVRSFANGLAQILLATQVPSCDVARCSALCDAVAQCAEDNVTIYLCSLLDNGLFKNRRVKSLKMEWYSTRRNADDGEQEHLPLCGMCANRFERRLEMVVASRL